MPEPVFLNKVVDHRLRKLLGQIPHIKRDFEFVGDSARIEGIIKRAAAPLPAITISLVARKREVYADHIMASIHHPGSRNRRVNASGHRDQYLHSNRQFVIWTSTKPYEMLWQQRPAAQLQLDRHPQKKTDTRN